MAPARKAKAMGPEKPLPVSCNVNDITSLIRGTTQDLEKWVTPTVSGNLMEIHVAISYGGAELRGYSYPRTRNKQ